MKITLEQWKGWGKILTPLENDVRRTLSLLRHGEVEEAQELLVTVLRSVGDLYTSILKVGQVAVQDSGNAYFLPSPNHRRLVAHLEEAIELADHIEHAQGRSNGGARLFGSITVLKEVQSVSLPAEPDSPPSMTAVLRELLRVVQSDIEAIEIMGAEALRQHQDPWWQEAAKRQAERIEAMLGEEGVKQEGE